MIGNCKNDKTVYFHESVNSFKWGRTNIIESKEIFDRQGKIFNIPEKTENYSIYDDKDDVLLWFGNGSYSFSADSGEAKGKILIDDKFVIKRGDIVCITGENGTGKQRFCQLFWA